MTHTDPGNSNSITVHRQIHMSSPKNEEIVDEPNTPSHKLHKYLLRTLRTDTTRDIFLKRKLINYTKNELQGINIYLN